MDPLHINYVRQARALLSSHGVVGQESEFLNSIQRALQNPVRPAELLQSLSNALAVPSLSWLVAHTFRPLLIDLAARWLDVDKVDIDKLCALGFLVEAHEELYPILLRLLKLPQLSGGPLNQYMATCDWDVARMPAEILQTLLLTYHRLVWVDSSLPSQLLWPLRPLKLLFSQHVDVAVRLLAIRCYAIQTDMTERERDKLFATYIGEPGSVDAYVYLGGVIEGDFRVAPAPHVDGWTLPLFEIDRIDAMRRTFSQNSHFYEWSETDRLEAPLLTVTNLSNHVVIVSGVLLLKQADFSPPAMTHGPSSFIMTATVRDVLRTLALQLSQRLPSLLTSSPSAGKTTLLNYLASMVCGTVAPIVSIHLADASLDAKALLGSYTSSPTSPGIFDWIDGALVRAMRAGKWVVFEDIDRASLDVLSTLVPLLESLGPTRGIGARAFIDVPGHGRIHAQNGFMIFATRSVSISRATEAAAGPSRLFPLPTFFGHQHLAEVILPAPRYDELPLILSGMYPSLSPLIDTLITVWVAARDGRSVGKGKLGRDVGLLDLFKLCHRVDSLSSGAHDSAAASIAAPPVLPLSPGKKEEVFLDILDLFAGDAPHRDSAPLAEHNPVIGAVARALDISTERVEWIVSQRTPELFQNKTGRTISVTLGRVTLIKHPPVEDSRRDTPADRPFALHRPSLRLLEQLAVATHVKEAVLLVGETGTGKTAAVQHLASLLGASLTVLNLSTQTESADITGGLKPVDPRLPASNLQERYTELFGQTFSRKRNAMFEDAVRKAFLAGKWSRLASLWRESARLAQERITASDVDAGKASGRKEEGHVTSPSPRKRRKVGTAVPVPQNSPWGDFDEAVRAFEAQFVDAHARFVFSFVEGPLVSALRKGDWVLLDEINLASPEVLESLLSILEGPFGSVTLTERGDLVPVPRNPFFRLFACMNPATDVGKRDLPSRLRSRFTEIFVPAPDSDRNALVAVVQQYIGHCALGDRSAILDVAEYYIAVKALAAAGRLSDGSNQSPHYNMRTLTRALSYAAQFVSAFGLRRALWEGCMMCFTMTLDASSSALVLQEAERHLLVQIKNPRSFLSQIPAMPPGAFVEEFAPFYLEAGPRTIVDPRDQYVLTPSVRSKILNLARVVAARNLPILVQGPTSSGKTSSIEFLAGRTGHRFVRINNHEHTDIQEYLGTYVSDPTSGKLVYQDGLLVRALRNGDWIVLDELNLAPSDVLEALNRLLDDNRELVIPETQEVIRPHAHFMLFATQNPPGLYGGRKPLSRAFRNRFVELHFEDVPRNELEVILCKRSRIAPSYAQRIVAVFNELQRRRQTSRVFETKQGFATLRDLFRWAGRQASDVKSLAEDGYMLLAERTRRNDDKDIVREVIQDVLNVTIDISSLYQDGGSSIQPGSGSVVWTSAMRRLSTLVTAALRHDEPVLLVGETGTGKTSICQIVANAWNKPLYSVNCHLNTETADLVGGLRPVRNKASRRTQLATRLSVEVRAAGVDGISYDEISAANCENVIERLLADPGSSAELIRTLKALRQELAATASLIEWQDGPLVEAMRAGSFFLLDEISLADDSVLERMNSVLEPSRTLILAEKGGHALDQVQICAQPGFNFLATMNPGGDFGKKELSPALRNRFTEIFVPAIDSPADLAQIVDAQWCEPELSFYTAHLLTFLDWTRQHLRPMKGSGLRDILAWTGFTNRMHRDAHGSLQAPALFHHAAHMTVVDGLATLVAGRSPPADSSASLTNQCCAKLEELVPLSMTDKESFEAVLRDASHRFYIGPFGIEKGDLQPVQAGFTLEAPTTRQNAMRILRACQLPKPILLEGSPGVGKTSLISAIASVAGHRLTRINLSDQTELSDLFGSDLPVEGGRPGEFAWRNAAFLRALEEGGWVLLDEMNLAPQPVLEGLNAVLDHRGTVYLPELGRSFARHPGFRVFAAQNPQQQGGGRKGLPKSFVNRFTRVFIRELSTADYIAICRHLQPKLATSELERIVLANERLHERTIAKGTFSSQGTPWEFNLRDILRWISLLRSHANLPPAVASRRSFDMVYLSRFRTPQDRKEASKVYCQSFDVEGEDFNQRPWMRVTPEFVQFGRTVLSRSSRGYSDGQYAILQAHLGVLQNAADCLEEGWLLILTGANGCGKTSLIRLLARLRGERLLEFSVNGATDTSDLLGGFEQCNLKRRLMALTDLVLEELAVVQQTGSATISADEYRDRLMWAIQGYSQGGLSDHSQSDIVPICLDILQWLDHYQSRPNNTRAKLRQQLVSLPSIDDAKGRFEWVDGPLVRAMRGGHWLLIDNANLSNASVLDRLNSVFEHDGLLVLNERGTVDGEIQVIRPHPSFRAIMIVDPRHGELSRAMRNRGIEIAVPDELSGECDGARLRHLIRLPSNLPSSPHGLLESLLESKRARLGVAETQRDDTLPGALTSAAFSSLLCRESALGNQAVPVHVALTAGDSDDLRISEAAALYLIQATSISATPFLRRLIKHPFSFARSGRQSAMSLVLEVPSAITDFVRTTRAEVAVALGLPARLLYEQPMDLELSLSFSGRTEIEFSTSMTLITGVMELLARLAVSTKREPYVSDAQGMEEVTQLERSRTIYMDEPPKGVEEAVTRLIYPLITSVWEAITEEIRLILRKNAKMHLEGLLNNMRDMLDFSEQLTRITQQYRLDFSALELVSRWFSDSGLRSHTSWETVFKLAVSFREALSPKRGLGMYEVWRRFCKMDMCDEWSRAPLALLSVEEASNGLAYSSVFVDARSKVFNLWVDFEGGNQSAEMQGNELQSCNDLIWELHRLPRRRIQEPEMADSCSVAMARLGFITSHGARRDQVADFLLKTVKSLAVHSPGYPLMRIASWQRLLSRRKWHFVDYGPHLLSDWLESLEGSKVDIQTDRTMNSGAILGPIELQQAMEMIHMGDQCLETLMVYEARITRHLLHSVALCNAPLPSRTHQINTALLQFVQSLCRCFESSYASDVISRVAASDALEVGNSDPSFEKWLQDITLTSNPSLARVLRQHVVPSLRAILHSSPSSADNMLATGKAWVTVSESLLNLYWPEIPMDPVASLQCEHALWRNRHDYVLDQLSCHTRSEQLITGNDSNGRTAILLRRLEGIRLRLSDIPLSTVSRTTDISSLHSLFAEFQQFLDRVIHGGRLSTLIDALEDLENTHALHMEDIAQKSIGSFVQRLQHAYHHMRDLTFTAVLAVRQLQFGLHLIVRARQLLSRRKQTPQMDMTLVPGMLCFPTVAAHGQTLRYAQGFAGFSSTLSMHRLLLSLSVAADEVEISGTLTPLIPLVQTFYLELHNRWSTDQEKERRRKTAEQSLYRSRDEEPSSRSDEDLQEAEFMDLFPDYSRAFEDQRQDGPTKEETVAENALFMQHVHYVIVGNSEKAPKSIESLFSRLRLREISKCPWSAYTDELDSLSVPFRLSALEDALSQLQTVVHTAGPYDFYKHGYPAEVRKACMILDQLVSRIAILMEQYPDQAQLQHVQDCCIDILKLPLQSPIARILSALEVLLGHIESWEGFAHRENSLKQQKDEIIALVVEWRRMELGCWAALLETEASSFADQVSEWWFPLYGAAVRPVVDVTSHPMDVEQHIHGLVPLLDEFMTSSPLGQYHARLNLMKSFVGFLAALAERGSTIAPSPSAATSCILHEILAYYMQFEMAVYSSLQSQRQPLEKQIDDFIRLASWRDINVNALKQSAQKTHRQLYKAIRKFRDVLRQPSAPLLTFPLDAGLERDVEIPPSDFEVPKFSGAASNCTFLPEHLETAPTIQVAHALLRLQAMSSSHLLPFLSFDASTSVDSLAVSVVTTVKHFSVETSRTTDVRMLKMLVTQKRKAWSDTLKELKSRGLSWRLPAGILTRQSDRSGLMQLASPLFGNEGQYPFRAMVAEADRYFARLCGCMPLMRSGLRDCHRDVSKQDMQRAIGFVEYTFSLGISGRKLLSRGCRAICFWEGVAQRLGDVGLATSPQRLVAIGSAVEVRTRNVLASTKRLVSALEEIVTMIRRIEQHQESSGFHETLVDDLQRVKHSHQSTAEGLDRLRLNVMKTNPPLLRSDERRLCDNAIDSILTTLHFLKRLSREYPGASFLLDPTSDWLEIELAQFAQGDAKPRDFAASSKSVTFLCDELISAILVAAQNLQTTALHDSVSVDQVDEPDNMPDAYRRMQRISEVLHFEALIAHFNAFLQALEVDDPSSNEAISRLLPFIYEYVDIAFRFVANLVRWNKAILKLTYVLCVAVRTVTVKGFCGPKDEQDLGTGQESRGEAVDGTGYGEGTGTENISDEVQDESQVEGVQNEAMEAPNDETSGAAQGERGEAVELGEDFEGDLEDMSELGSEEEKDSSSDSEAPLGDDQVGPLDPLDPSALDEKIWGQDQASESDDKPSEVTQRPPKFQGASNEVAAQATEPKDSGSFDQEASEQTTLEELDPRLDEDSVVDDAPADDRSADVQVPDNIPEGDALNLPEDLNLGDDGDEQDRDQLMSVESSEGDDHLSDVSRGDDAEIDDDATGRPQEEPVDVNQTESAPNESTESAEDPAEVAGTAASDFAPNSLRKSPTTGGGQAESESQLPQLHQPEHVATEVQRSQEGADGQGYGKANSGHIPPEDAEMSSIDDLSSSVPDYDSLSNDRTDHRMLGEQAKVAIRPVEEILHSTASDAQKSNPVEAHSQPRSLEYLGQDDTVDWDMQALGPKQDAEGPDLNEMNLLEALQREDSSAMDWEPADAEDKNSEQPISNSDAVGSQMEYALTKDDVHRRSGVTPDGLFDPAAEFEEDESEDTKAIVEDPESVLRLWQAHGQPASSAHGLWQMYSSITQELAYALCEQLRLVLEPTRATRLKGDYRTGKRLNMKKIIPYIASDFTKDKIWLRRTRPSRREYQVLIALDDSRSMAESHSVHLAYQTLALVSTALGKLEVGDVAIARFGETVEILHDFEAGSVTDEVGAQIMSHFTFAQIGTDVHALLDRSLAVLEVARAGRNQSSSTAADLWQLQIIISDGICQSHDRLRALLRRAEEQKVIVVFVVLDALHRASAPGSQAASMQGSILSMMQGSYKEVNGQMELQMVPYMDTFPFDYYIILRDVNALPDVLSSTLRQFFEIR